MIKHYKAVLLSDIHRVWHFMTIQFPSRRRTQVHFHTLSWFKCFLIEKLWGKQWLLIWQAVVILTENVEPWMWKMSACLEMQSFFLTCWSTHRQTSNTPGTFWWDFFKLYGVLWHCCNPNYVPQGRDTPSNTNAMYIGFGTSNLCNPLHISWVQGQQHLYLQEEPVASVMSLCKLSSSLRYGLVSCSPSLALLSLYKSLHFKQTTGPHFLMLGQASSRGEVGGMGHHLEAFQKPPSCSNCSL